MNNCNVGLRRLDSDAYRGNVLFTLSGGLPPADLRFCE